LYATGVDGIYKSGSATTVVDAHITFAIDTPDNLIQDALAKLKERLDALYDKSALQAQWGLLNSAQVRKIAFEHCHCQKYMCLQLVMHRGTLSLFS
jgi:hypothetical protein